MPTMSDETLPIHDRILDAARRLFLSKGYNGSNLRHIAKEAGVSMGGIYHHFGSKEEIYYALIRDTSVAQELGELVQRCREPEFPLNLGEIGADIFAVCRKHQDYFKLLYIDVLEFGGRNSSEAVNGFRDAMLKTAEQLLAHRAGELSDVNPAIVIRSMIDIFLFTYLEGVMLGKSFSEDLGMTDEELAQQMAQLVLFGAMKR